MTHAHLIEALVAGTFDEQEGWEDIVPALGMLRTRASHSRADLVGLRLRISADKQGHWFGTLSYPAAAHFQSLDLKWVRLLSRGEQVMLRGEMERDDERRVRRLRGARGNLFSIPTLGVWPHGTVIPLEEYAPGRLVGIPQLPQEGDDDDAGS